MAQSGASPLPEAAHNRAVVLALYGAVMRRDTDGIAAFLAPDAVLVEAPSLPAAGVHRGKEAFLAAAAVMLEHLDLSEAAIDAVVAEGDSVACLLRAGWRRSDGTTIDVAIAEWWRLRDGKIVECRPHYQDTAAMLAGRP